MFDCLTSEHWPDIKFAIGAIFQACGKQNVQVVMFTHMQEKAEDWELETKFDVCVNHRYAQRHDAMHIKPDDDPAPVKVVEKVPDAKKQVKAKS